MLIIAGYLKLPPARRRAFIEAHADLATRARAYPGCLDLSIRENPGDPSRINIVELWESAAALDAWWEMSNPPRGRGADRGRRVWNRDAHADVESEQVHLKDV